MSRVARGDRSPPSLLVAVIYLMFAMLSFVADRAPVAAAQDGQSSTVVVWLADLAISEGLLWADTSFGAALPTFGFVASGATGLDAQGGGVRFGTRTRSPGLGEHGWA